MRALLSRDTRVLIRHAMSVPFFYAICWCTVLYFEPLRLPSVLCVRARQMRSACASSCWHASLPVYVVLGISHSESGVVVMQLPQHAELLFEHAHVSWLFLPNLPVL